MKSIATVNTILPTIENCIEYLSNMSLRDYDIALFDPKFPYQDRVTFSDGGSCVSVEASQYLEKAIKHWTRELHSAIEGEKTVFILLNEYETDLCATGNTYSTVTINNYEPIPCKLTVKNARGKQMLVADNNYKGLYNIVKEISHYKVIIEPTIGKKIFTAKDGTVIASVVKLENLSGNLVLLPYFNFLDDDEDEHWSDDSIRISNAIVSQLIAIDKSLQLNDGRSPSPEWIGNVEIPTKISDIDKAVTLIELEITLLEKRKEIEQQHKDELTEFFNLLYESGKNLEFVIEKSLILLGYVVENYRQNDLEIDHIIVSPDGIRMIGESEGKDNSAIDISKFRQLESNINEDFERDTVNMPAKGILFGNGFRFIHPNERQEQFTQKCLTNAKRLGTALIRTSDLYEAIVYILDNPNDEQFKKSCRKAIENTIGEIVTFPSPKRKSNISKKQNKKDNKLSFNQAKDLDQKDQDTIHAA